MKIFSKTPVEMIPTYKDIVEMKKLTKEQRVNDLIKLRDYDANENKRCFHGNPFIYHYQIDNLCKVKTNGSSLYDVMKNDREKLWAETQKRKRSGTDANRMFECYRVNRGSVVIFKSTTAKYLYKKFGATSVLDPTAGWGGRMLAAWSLGIPYIGFDTNEKMKTAYEDMMEEMACMDGPCDLTMRFEDSLTADWSGIEYDFVLSSPPYINLEIYEGMTPFESAEKFYMKFLIPLIKKCLDNCKPGGWVCFNISPKMYKDLMKFGFKACDEQHDLLQQKKKGIDKGDKIYCWRT
jgi:hypothetical protein